MRWLLLTIVVGTVAWTASHPRPASCQERKPADYRWVVGTWRSSKLDYGEFREWKGATRIELVATSPDEIGLFLITADGKRSRAGDSEPSIMDDRRLFFGPVGSGLSFGYKDPTDDVLVLDLKTGGTRIHAELRRRKE
jgi:hypothetical protein